MTSGMMKQMCLQLRRLHRLDETTCTELASLCCQRYIYSYSQLVGPLRSEQSPLLQPCVIASQPKSPGASVTIDNVQLGMLVQKGRHWDDGDDDGGPGCIGIIEKS